MFAYDPSEWTDLFVATAGASAALAGLVFLASALLISVVALVPGQSHVALGVELLVVSLGIDAIVMRQPTIHVEEGEGMRRSWRVSRWALRLAPPVPLLLG